MKTLIEAVEAWIDDRITNNIAVDRADRMSHSASVGVLNWHGKFKEMLARAHQNESIAVRQANRIDELERRIKIMNDSPPIGRESATDLSNRIEHLERRVELLIDESDTGRLDDVDNRLDDLKCSVEEKVDSCDVDDKVELALSAQDLPDVYSIEAMIETKVGEAVREEIDATDFKITVER